MLLMRTVVPVFGVITFASGVEASQMSRESLNVDTPGSDGMGLATPLTCSVTASVGLVRWPRETPPERAHQLMRAADAVTRTEQIRFVAHREWFINLHHPAWGLKEASAYETSHVSTQRE